jgi:non-canonical purine NTP pyrophosphatase (RdgB/HAM1 family)
MVGGCNKQPTADTDGNGDYVSERELASSEATNEVKAEYTVKAEVFESLEGYTVVYPDKNEITAEGYMMGRITSQPSGIGGFGYDPVFIPEGYEKTFASLSAEVKNTISHRARAMEELRRIINNQQLV